MRALVFVAVLLFPGVAWAQAKVLLHEIIPALAQSELGALEIGEAPAPGSSRTVRRREVLRALSAAGHSPRGLAIPRATRIRREEQVIEREQLARLIRPALERARAPWSVGQVRGQRSVTLPKGQVEVRTDARAPVRGRSLGAFVELRVGGQSRRLPVRAALQCPDPTVKVGSRVRIVVQVGNVRATATGVARQAGRVGDLVKVSRSDGHTTLLARVLSEDEVELVR